MQGFDRVADLYERHRPGYPDAAVDIVADRLRIGPGRRVLDLAAGTGKLTREWVARGAEVVAVEPVAGMRDVLARELPDARVLDGRAEDLPLDDASVDAVTVAQAFHWFDGDRALAEMQRVLAPGGRLAVVFNRRDTSTPVQAAIDELLAAHRGDTPSWASHDWPRSLDTTDRFDALTSADYPFAQELDADGLVGRVASVSFVAQLDDPTRARVLDAVQDVFARLARPDADGTARVALEYVCEVRVLARASG